jgi:hypothetical protein
VREHLDLMGAAAARRHEPRHHRRAAAVVLHLLRNPSVLPAGRDRRGQWQVRDHLPMRIDHKELRGIGIDRGSWGEDPRCAEVETNACMRRAGEEARGITYAAVVPVQRRI